MSTTFVIDVFDSNVRHNEQLNIVSFPDLFISPDLVQHRPPPHANLRELE
jgi:hypothetical protein